MQGNKSVIVIRMVVALLILFAIFGLYGKRFLPQRWGTVAGTSGVIVYATSRGHFSVLKPQHFASMRKRGDAL